MAMKAGFLPSLTFLLLLGLTFPGRSHASLSVSPSRIWLSQYVLVSVDAIGWVDAVTGQTNSEPSQLGSGSWIFPNVTVSDGQSFSNLWSSSNVFLLSFPPAETGPVTITAGSETVTVEVVDAGDLTNSPSPVAVGTTVTFTVPLIPSTSSPPSLLEWTPNVAGSGTSTTGTWTNGGTYTVSLWANDAYIYRSVQFAVFEIVGGFADSSAQCCGGTNSGGTNTFHVVMFPGQEGSLVNWTGAPLDGTDWGEERTVNFTNTGLATITATCGTSTFTFTNKVVRTEIDALLKTNYLAYGATNTVMITLATNAFGEVDWTAPGLTIAAQTDSSLTLDLPPETAAGEYTITATSRDTGVCTDMAKVYVVKVDYLPELLVIPVGGTGLVSVAVQPESVTNLLVFSGSPTNIATISTNAPALDVAAGTNTGTVSITASINGVSLLSTGKVAVFTAEFTNRNVDVAELGSTAGSVKIIPGEYADVAASHLVFDTENAGIATIAGSGTNFTVTGNYYGETQFFITAGVFTNRLDTATGTVVRVEVISTTMSGATMVNLKKDSNGEPYVVGAAPHWTEGGTSSHPVAYKATTITATSTNAITNVVSAQFRVLPASYNRDVHLKGDGSSFQYTNQTATASAGEVIYPATLASAPFGSAVDKAQLTINWSFALDGTNFQSAKASINDYYLTLAAPPETYHTVLDVACRHSTGAEDPYEAMAGIWPQFESRQVRRVDGTVMAYWGALAEDLDLLTTQHLVSNADGGCGAWANFLIEAAKCHDIAATYQSITYFPSGTFGAPYADYYAPGPPLDPTPPEFFVNALPAQGNETPRRRFINHAVVWVGNTIYDPSYGVPYEGDTALAAKHKWEDASLRAIEYRSTLDLSKQLIHNDPLDNVLWTKW